MSISDSAEARNIRMLLVDDEQDVLTTTKLLLESKGGFKVETAGSVDQANKMLIEKPFDVIVSDYQMPGKDGLQFLKELRGRGDSTPFIVLTGRGREEVAIEALNLGADRYIQKGGGLEAMYAELIDAINACVQHTSLHKRLIESEERFRSLVEYAKAAIVIVDLAGRFTYVNKAFPEMLGYSTQELLGRNIKDCLYPDDKDRVEQLLRGQDSSIDFRMICKDGKVLNFMAKPSKLEKNDKKVGVQAIMIDTTERRAKDAKERRLATVLSDSNDAITVLDLAGRIIAWNKGAELLYGYSEAEALKMSINDIIPNSSKQEIINIFKEIKTNEMHQHFESKRLTKDGHTLDVWLTITPLLDDRRKIVAIATTERDITELKRLEEERLKSMGEVARGIGHDIRNPMQVIRNAVSLLRGKVGDEGLELLGMIDRNVESAENIMRNLKDLTATPTLTLEEGDVNDLLRKVLSETLLPENVKLTTSYGTIPPIPVDGGELRRVFSNLIKNAVEAMLEVGKLSISTGKTDGSVEIKVNDTGVGIPQKNLEKIFHPFYTTKEKGTGLGLINAKKIVEAHGGTITLESEEGKGTTVTVLLPLTPIRTN